ncbi:hypothetical protein GCM10022240_11180 [Microbacterium kribbense]|uniref:Uncharacterized protein n=1 Tax=Microbacterium kribbense TaxID=433645 RepID=A0ABP7GDH8_9MICO
MSAPELAPPRGTFLGVVAVWVVAVLIGVAVGIFAPVAQRAGWLLVGLAGSLVASFIVQLWFGHPRRFLARVALSMLGSLFLLGVISAGFGLAALGA